MSWDRLFDAGILVITGKGGTGKSTVAAALAMAGAANGRHVMLAEVEGRGEVTRTLGVADPGYTERPTPFGFHVLSITPREAALEYLRRYYGMDRVSRPLLRSGALDQVIRGAPGFRDLLASGKVYELARVHRSDTHPEGHAAYDLVVIDAPPTGQIAAFLDAPAAFSELIRVGRMQRHAASVAALFHRRARVVMVTVPEEMAVIETLEAIPAIAATGIALGAVVLNRALSPAFPPGLAIIGRRLTAEATRSAAARAGLVLNGAQAGALVQGAAASGRRARVQRSFEHRLREAAPVFTLPDIAAGAPVERTTALAGVVRGDPRSARASLGVPALPRLPRRFGGQLDRPLGGARIVVVCGSGGVGKTTVSAAVAIHLAEAGLRTVLLTVDPARRLATALRLPTLAGDRTEVRLARGRSMEALQLDTKRTFDELVDRFADSPERRERILGNPFYRRMADTLGGTHEYMAMEKLHQLAEEDRHDVIVIDTPPTRSALSFLDAPKRLTDFLGGRFLRFMLWPSVRAGRLSLGAARFGTAAFLRAVGRMIGSESLADTVEFLNAFQGMYAGFKERAAEVVELMASPACRFVVVTSPTPTSLEEAGYFLTRLAAGGMHAAAVVANRWHPDQAPVPAKAASAVRRLAGGDPTERAVAGMLEEGLRRRVRLAAEGRAMGGFAAAHPRMQVVAVPDLAGDVQDVAGLRRIAARLFADGAHGGEAGPKPPPAG